MQSSLIGLVNLFKTKPVKALTPSEFKKLSYNDVQQVLYVALKRIGLKPHITKHIFPPCRGIDVSIDCVHLINGSKVTVELINPFNSLLLIKVEGPQKLITDYTSKIDKASKALINNSAIVLDAIQYDYDKKPSLLVISQYVSPITNVSCTIRHTLMHIK